LVPPVAAEPPAALVPPAAPLVTAVVPPTAFDVPPVAPTVVPPVALVPPEALALPPLLVERPPVVLAFVWPPTLLDGGATPSDPQPTNRTKLIPATKLVRMLDSSITFRACHFRYRLIFLLSVESGSNYTFFPVQKRIPKQPTVAQGSLEREPQLADNEYIALSNWGHKAT
jgi:hypothetical protein